MVILTVANVGRANFLEDGETFHNLETRFDTSPHLKPGNNHDARPDCKQNAHGL
jgi:hypothetical protein